MVTGVPALAKRAVALKRLRWLEVRFQACANPPGLGEVYDLAGDHGSVVRMLPHRLHSTPRSSGTTLFQ